MVFAKHLTDGQIGTTAQFILLVAATVHEYFAAVVRPETVIRWHRAGFRGYWRWRSSLRRDRPTVPVEIRQLIREMSLANPLWGAPRRDRGLYTPKPGWSEADETLRRRIVASAERYLAEAETSSSPALRIR
jgi:hypothetical protein